MTDEDIEKIIKRHMSLQMNLAGIRVDLEEAFRKPFVGLTDEQMDDIYYCVEGGASELETWREQARAIEDKLKEKNT